MKLSLVIAALAGIAFQAADASAHLRVHILTELAVAGEQCMWEDKAKKCDAASFCQNSDKHTGFCMKKKPGLGDQCGGKGTDGPWAVPCSGGLGCVLESNTMSKCQTKTDRQ
ncbi:HEAT repeat-containing protein 6 [Phytophthora pseudosyringae]|uniref:HEAT repeat-containing protein 6 n=1 Tax=Phytophthora pseudosyringae TaxID=221518 RepID=A0A8T1VEM4_9STRA|nr:HEAT repeat-containing protein 6 [Phytophthora pseudosyringae]